jgi:hypothetical protein
MWLRVRRHRYDSVIQLASATLLCDPCQSEIAEILTTPILPSAQAFPEPCRENQERELRDCEIDL